MITKFKIKKKISSFFGKLKTEKTLLAILAVYFLAHFFYIWYDNSPPHWDAAAHLTDSIDYGQYLHGIFFANSFNLKIVELLNFLLRYRYYPPGLPWINAIFFQFLGGSYKVALLVNFVWILLLVFSLKAWLETLKIDKFARNVVIIFTLGIPYLIGSSRDLMLDLPVLACYFLILFLVENLLKKFNYRNLFFLILAISYSLLVKWSIAFLLPLIILFYLIRQFQVYKQQPEIFQKYLYKLPFFGFLTILLNFWYLNNAEFLYKDFAYFNTVYGLAEGDPQGIGLESFLFYFNSFIIYFWFGWILFMVILSLIIFLNRSKINFKLVDRPIIWNVFYTVINFSTYGIYLLYQSNKDSRYAIFLLQFFIFFVALFSHFLIQFDFKPVYKKLFFYFTIIVFSINLVNLTLPLGNFSLQIKYNIPTFKSHYSFIFLDNKGFVTLRPRQLDWPIYSILETIKTEKQEFLDSNNTCLYTDELSNKFVTVGADFFVVEKNIPDTQLINFKTNKVTLKALANQEGIKFVDKNSEACFLVTRSLEKDTDFYLRYYEEIFAPIAKIKENFDGYEKTDFVLLKRKI